MDDYLKRGETFNIAVTKLQQFHFSSEDTASCIWTFSEHLCDERGRFAKALCETQHRNNKELQDTIERMEKNRMRTSGDHGAKAAGKDRRPGRSSTSIF